MSMLFCEVKVVSIVSNRLTREEDGAVDEVFFMLSGGSASDRASGSKIGTWDTRPGGQVPRNITLWKGFVNPDETAILTVTFKEEDTFDDDVIGKFKVRITGSSPNPSFLWEADSRFTSIAGAANGTSTTISVRESGADYLLTVEVVFNQGSTITNVLSNKCLDVAGVSKNDNANVQQFTCHGKPNQKWLLRVFRSYPATAGSPPFPTPSPRLGNDPIPLFRTFLLHAGHSGSCLDIEDVPGSKNVQQFHPHFGLNQLWFILPASQPGEFFIISAVDGSALDVEGESLADGGNVQVYPFNGNANQRWRINPLPRRHSTN